MTAGTNGDSSQEDDHLQVVIRALEQRLGRGVESVRSEKNETLFGLYLQ
jgi:hypothetical protein